MSCGCALSVAVLVLVSAVAADPATAGTGKEVQGRPLRAGEQGAAGAQCPTFVVFTAPDGCSSCSCSVDARMTDCTRSTCADPGNYTLNECVENALYVGSDGCNSCKCNAWRSFSSCTRKICLLSDASTRAVAQSPQTRATLPRNSRLTTTSPAPAPGSSAYSPSTRTRGSVRHGTNSSRRPWNSSTTPGGR